MVIDTSGIVVLALLVLVASLASYLWSQWPAFAPNVPIARASVGIGCALLLIAATLAILSLRWPTLLPTLNRDDAQIATREPAVRAPIEHKTPPSDLAAADTSRPPAAMQSVFDPIVSGRTQSTSRTQPNGNAALAAVTPRHATADRGSESISEFSGVLLNSADPWSATPCVLAFHRDPADLTLWSIENTCGAAVAILIAACDQATHECRERGSTAWKYLPTEMLLPGKHQRSVTYAEQLQQGRHIRYLACIVTSARALELIGIDVAARSPAWSEQFAAAREGDDCLARVRHWSEIGRHSGKSIDALVGGDLPGRTTQSR